MVRSVRPRRRRRAHSTPLAPAAVPDDSPWGRGGFKRCCGAQAVVVNTAAHCGGCRIACRSGSCRAALGRYDCGRSSNARCAPGISRTQSPDANLCACENHSACPAGMPCVNVSFNPNDCSL